MNLNNQKIRDIIEWDIKNWSKALNFWLERGLSISNKKVLTIGERNGGISLWFALNNAHVYSTDLNGVSEKANELHRKYNIEKLIEYDNANFLQLKYDDNIFDVVAFKSVLGALRNLENQKKAIEEAWRVLKPGGILCFAENLEASSIHKFFRKHFIEWAVYWRYIKLDELNDIFSVFSATHFKTYGLLGVFGRNEIQRKILGIIDSMICRFSPKSLRYILFGYCVK